MHPGCFGECCGQPMIPDCRPLAGSQGPTSRKGGRILKSDHQLRREITEQKCFGTPLGKKILLRVRNLRSGGKKCRRAPRSPHRAPKTSAGPWAARFSGQALSGRSRRGEATAALDCDIRQTLVEGRGLPLPHKANGLGGPVFSPAGSLRWCGRLERLPHL